MAQHLPIKFLSVCETEKRKKEGKKREGERRGQGGKCQLPTEISYRFCSVATEHRYTVHFQEER